jgi:ABC-type polysaccharide/polyol phosphate export permease
VLQHLQFLGILEAWDLVSMILALFFLFCGSIKSGMFLNVLSVNKNLAGGKACPHDISLRRA